MDDCIFCKIAAGSVPVEALCEDEMVIAFADKNPQAPTHLLFIPRQHFASASHAPATLLGNLLAQASEYATRELPEGYRLVINTGEDGGQTVHHLHVHLLGGRTMHWPPG